MNRHTTLIIAAAVFFFTANIATAANSGGMAAPLDVGAAALSVALKYSEQEVENDSTEDLAKTRGIMFKGIFGVGNNIDFYAMLGLTDLRYRVRNFKGSLGETVGLGVRYSPVRVADGSDIVIDFQSEYMASEDRTEKVTRLSYHVAAYMVSELGSAGSAGYFYPYAGVRLSYADYDNDAFEDYDNEYVFGVIGGADYFVNPNVFFTMEFNLFDEETVTLGAGYRF